MATNRVASLCALQGRRILTETEDRSRRKSRSDTPHQTMLAVGFLEGLHFSNAEPYAVVSVAKSGTMRHDRSVVFVVLHI